MSLRDYLFYEEPSIQLYCGDCREILLLLEDRARLVLTDPPYGIVGGLFWRRSGTALENWDNNPENMQVDDWAGRASTVMLSDAYLAEFCSMQIPHLEATFERHRKAGLIPWTRYLIVKSSPAPCARPIFVSAFEEAIISRKGGPKWQGTRYVPNRWIGQTPNRSHDSWGHPTEKPIEPLQVLVRSLAEVGATVLDPFSGSGTTLEAAKLEHRRAIGIEIEPKYCELTVKRLRQEILPLSLPILAQTENLTLL